MKKEILIEIEKIEKRYLDQMVFMLSQDIDKMMDGLRSKDKIKYDWIKAFDRIDKQRKNSDFARGAERIYSWLFNQFGKPNSSPIGADMFFETHDAFVHIDIKTAKLDNPSDYKGKIPLSENQTNYKSKNKNFNSNLPTFYNKGKNEEKICLTYIIDIIYDEKEDFKIKAIIIFSVPNGELYLIYKDSIIAQGKNKGKSFRYLYRSKPHYKLLEGKPFRLKVLWLDKDLEEKDILGFSTENIKMIEENLK